jgi:hypothetical protein
VTPRSGLRSAIAAAAIAAAAAILVVELFVPPVIGLADNGDFEKVMGPAGFRYRETAFDAKYLRYVVQDFAFAPPGWYASGYRSSESLVAGLARRIAGSFSTASFDIRILGGLHAILFLSALLLLLAACRDLAPAAQCTAAALLVFFFTDVGYAGPFNTFYSQTASLLFLLLAVGAGALGVARGRPAFGLLLAYFLCAALFVCSKPQESIQGPLLAAFGLRLASTPDGRSWRRPAAWLAAGLCALSLWYYRQAPKESIRNVGLFHTLFMEVLPHSPDAGRDLDELGLDRGLLRYSGTNAYAAGTPLADPDFAARFFDRFDYGSLVRFYLAHPARLVDRLHRGAPSALRLRPWRLANYTAASGHPPNTMTRHFDWWSSPRLALRSVASAWLLLLLGGSAAACAVGDRRADRRGRLFREGLCLLVLMAVVEYLVCALADYLGDLGRHLYVFQGLCDLILAIDAAWIVQSLARSEPAS